jgi:hypothetical protein
VAETRAPTADEITIMRKKLDPNGVGSKEVQG